MGFQFQLAIELVAFERFYLLAAASVEAGEDGWSTAVEVLVTNGLWVHALHQSNMIALGKHWTVGAGWLLEALILVVLILGE